MPDKIPISRKVFEQLHDAIVEKFIQKNKVKPSQEHLYGFNNFDETAPSIRKFMLDKHEEKYDVKFYHKDFPRGFNGKKLLEYNRKPKYNRNSQQLIDIGYLKMYLLYLGFDSLEEFENAIGKLDNEQIEQDEIVKYTGYFYSNSHELRPFEIIFNFSKQEVLIEKTPTGTRYEGKIQDLAVNTSMTLESVSTPTNEKRILHIILYRGTVHLKNRNYALGVFSNVSERGHPFCGLIVFRKNDTIDKEGYEEIKSIITKYLEGTQIRMDATSVIYPRELREVIEKSILIGKYMIRF